MSMTPATAHSDDAPAARGAEPRLDALLAGSPATAVSTETLAAHLTALPDAEVAALLACRPDLLAPPSSSFTTLAARAGARPSVEVALAELDAAVLAVAEAVVATGTQDPAVLGAALVLPDDDVARHLSTLHRLVLVLDTGPVPGLVEAFGPHPLGLAPADPQDPAPAGDADDAGQEGSPRSDADLPTSLARLHAAAQQTEAQRAAAPHCRAGEVPAAAAQQTEAGPPSAQRSAADATPPAVPDASQTAAPEAPPADSSAEDTPVLPPAALAVLDALTWGPPVGTLREGGQAPGAAPLIERGWLKRTHDSSGATRFLLPRRVALALRGGRLLREAPTAPDPTALPLQDPATTADQASRAAEETVRLVAALLDEWGREGGPILRTGGVGVRALTRTADALGLDTATAARVIEVTAGAGLLGLDDAGATWVPSLEVPHWRTADLPERWAPLVTAWAASARTPWLVGTRGDDGALRPVLGDDVEAAWARTLRRRVLLLLDGLPEGAVADAGWVRSALTWARPRRPVPADAVTGVLTEAEALGVTGGGALSRAGRLLARALREHTLPPPDGEADPRLLCALEQALSEDLAAPVDVLLVQSDLTAIVPGRPAPALGELLERSSTVESRGSALTVRFTAESVRAALDAGRSADELHQDLERWSPAPLPAALSVLIEDVARHHGAVRVREVASLLRVPDPATAAGLLADARLRGLGLDEVAPGVLTASVPAGQVLRELRAAGLSPVLEDTSGHLLLAGDAVGARRGTPEVETVRPGSAAPATRRRRPSSRDLAVLVGRLRAGEQARRDSGVPAGAATDPVHALAVLRQAQASRSRLRLRLASPDGSLQERQARVLAVEAGRVRLADLQRETELTVAVHRIASVEQV